MSTTMLVSVVESHIPELPGPQGSDLSFVFPIVAS